MHPLLTSVTPQDGHCLLLEYDSGERRVFDVAPYITGSWFGELLEPSYFNCVSMLAGGRGISWPNGQDIAPHELYELSIAV